MMASPYFAALQILCGLFFLPHAWAKWRNPEASIALFDSVGLRPPLFWIRVAIVIELFVAACLTFDVITFYAAIVGGIFLLLSAAAILGVSRGKWRWNDGGAEYPVFWAIACFFIASQAQ